MADASLSYGENDVVEELLSWLSQAPNPDKEAFMNCDSLKRITIPEGVEEIGESAFQGCSKLEKVIIPKSVKRIGADAFKGCKKLPEMPCTLEQ